MKSDDVGTLSAAVAFKLFLSLFPALVAAVGIFGLVADPEDLSDLVSQLTLVLPQEAVDLVTDQLAVISTQSKAATAVIAGIAVGLWAASGAAVTLMKTLSQAYDVDEDRRLVRLRLSGVIECVALLVTLSILALLLVAGPQLEDALLGDAPRWLDAAVTVVRYVLAVALLSLMLSFTYWIGPNRKPPSWQWISPGAVVAMLGWIGASLAFSVYVQHFANLSTYGALAAPIVLMLWLQLTMLMVLVGAQLNAELLRRRDVREQAVPERDHGGRDAVSRTVRLPNASESTPTT